MRSKRTLLLNKNWMPSSRSLSSYVVPNNPEIWWYCWEIFLLFLPLLSIVYLVLRNSPYVHLGLSPRGFRKQNPVHSIVIRHILHFFSLNFIPHVSAHLHMLVIEFWRVSLVRQVAYGVCYFGIYSPRTLK